MSRSRRISNGGRSRPGLCVHQLTVGTISFSAGLEALINSDRSQFAAWLRNQPAWSDLPVVLLAMQGTEFESVRSALRARARQLEVKSHLEQKQEVADRQKLLIRELHHRVKNTPANVRAMMGANGPAIAATASCVISPQESCRLPTRTQCLQTTIGRRPLYRSCLRRN